MKNQKMDNRGLTLVEVLVAIVISTVVIGAIWQFMLISTRSYDSQKTITDLQQDVQQTMNQAENLIIDADRAIDYRETATERILEVFGSKKIGKLVWNQESKTLSYTETAVADGVVSGTSESAILADGVESFAADTSKVESNKIVKISMGFAKKGKTYEASRNITLRNLIVSSGVVSEIYKGDITPEVVPEIVFNDPETAVDPGKSYGYQATVTGSDDTTLIWTVIATSENTVMDVPTGRLTVGMDEPVGTITVIATLASNRDIVAMQEVTVNEAPPVAINIDHFPKTVLYGGSYRIEATTNPVGYLVEWEVVSGNASIENTTTQYGGKITNLDVSMTQDGSQTIQVVAKVKIDEQRVVTTEPLVATIRKPGFVVKSTDYNNAVNPQQFDRGSEVILSADWKQSYENNNNYVEADEAFYGRKYINYTNGVFTNETIEWVYYLGNSTEAIEVEGNSFTLPTDMSVSQVKVVGTSAKYPYITAQQVLNLKDPSVSITATVDNSNIGTGPVPFNKTVTLAAGVAGMDSASAVFAEWDAVDSDGNDVPLNVASNGRTATFKLTNTKKYKGKQITVTVKEVKTNKTATITLEVMEFVDCDKGFQDTPDAEYKYIFAKRSSGSSNYRYPAQNSFFIPMENMDNVNFRYKFYSKNGGEIQNFQEVMSFTVKDDGVLCDPQEESWRSTYNYDNFGYITLHFDDKDTGEHIALYRLVPVTTTYSYDGVYYVLPCEPSNLSQLYVSGEYTQPQGEGVYLNFYGEEINDYIWNYDSDNYPEPITYEYKYTYEYKRINSVGNRRNTYKIEVEHEGNGGFTLNYYYRDNSWRAY